uniref:Uncharacterized protein n=1 Tax=Rhizophagus irregularis (strain DAOM 181602 / DAOM 197198 / MUCL 43194) TaxID=747089 RepID=U9UBN4_RHIID
MRYTVIYSTKFSLIIPGFPIIITNLLIPKFLAGFLNMQESIKMKTDNIFIHELQRYSLIIINLTVPS